MRSCSPGVDAHPSLLRVWAPGQLAPHEPVDCLRRRRRLRHGWWQQRFHGCCSSCCRGLEQRHAMDFRRSPQAAAEAGGIVQPSPSTAVLAPCPAGGGGRPHLFPALDRTWARQLPGNCPGLRPPSSLGARAQSWRRGAQASAHVGQSGALGSRRSRLKTAPVASSRVSTTPPLRWAAAESLSPTVHISSEGCQS